jgi:hypothetical protein
MEPRRVRRLGARLPALRAAEGKPSRYDEGNG